jgi:hypothetical protein
MLSRLSSILKRRRPEPPELASHTSKVLDDFRRRARLEERRTREEWAALSAAMDREAAAATELISTSCWEVDAARYSRFIRKFIENGGRPTHSYDYSFPENVFVACRSFCMLPLYGARAVTILIPADLEVTGMPGHCNLLKKNGEIQSGSCPIYLDT